MKLLIIRHGEASWDAPSDRERELTPRGELQLPDLGRWLVDAGHSPNAVYASPYRRTQQSAALLCQSLGKESWHTASWITPDKNPGSVASQLHAGAEEVVALVSHQPLVGRLLNYLLTGDKTGSPVFNPATIAVLDMPEIGPGCAGLLHLGHYPDYTHNAR